MLQLFSYHLHASLPIGSFLFLNLTFHVLSIYLGKLTGLVMIFHRHRTYVYRFVQCRWIRRERCKLANNVISVNSYTIHVVFRNSVVVFIITTFHNLIGLTTTIIITIIFTSVVIFVLKSIFAWCSWDRHELTILLHNDGVVAERQIYCFAVLLLLTSCEKL